ncbi:MAG: hypothetical protein J5I93_02640 [Pirellulaceae bacterium]|nr:hypothetical protein [Pirellulaceae bacterium]
MIVVNFSHPLTEPQQAQLVELLGERPARIVDLRAVLDPQRELGPQSAALVEQSGLSPQAWQGERLLVVLPSLNFLAAAVLAELHGRMGFFPTVLRLRPVAGVVPPQYEVAEIVNLQAIRDDARQRR